jgi:hypothetical protein
MAKVGTSYDDQDRKPDTANHETRAQTYGLNLEAIQQIFICIHDILHNRAQCSHS